MTWSSNTGEPLPGMPTIQLPNAAHKPRHNPPMHIISFHLHLHVFKDLASVNSGATIDIVLVLYRNTLGLQYPSVKVQYEKSENDGLTM